MTLPIKTERLVLRKYRHDDVADMLACNTSSRRLMERLGMRREAHFREGHTGFPQVTGREQEGMLFR